MKMEDKLIEEYRNRSVEYRLPLPEDGGSSVFFGSFRFCSLLYGDR